MSELRWNPVLEEWVITAAHRQARPIQLKKNDPGKCLLCPGGAEAPADYDICVFENRFPSLNRNAPEPIVRGDDLYRVKKARGICEVVLYSPKHGSSLARESAGHIKKLIDVWQDRFRELGSLKYIKYVFIFENRGDAIGVTLSHPHGQIYAYRYIPPKIEKEIASSKKYFRRSRRGRSRCLFCEIHRREKKHGRRIVLQGKHFTAFVPFYARWPYEVHIYSKRHVQTILDLAEAEKNDLSKILKKMLVKYDGLFGFPLPFMMVMHQAPTDGRKYPYYHFHIEFYPPHRAKDKIKYLAGCESGAGSFINDTSAEEKAAELRQVKA